MKNRLIVFTVLVTAVSLLAFFGFGILVTENQYYKQAEHKIIDIARIYAETYTDAESAVKKHIENIRVTVIDSEGFVIADSEQVNTSSLENHLGREEITAALNGEPKTVKRQSSTLGEKMVYYALKVDTADGYVFLRVSIPVESVRGYVIESIPLMIYVLCGALLCSLFASVAMGNRVMKPLREIDSNLKAIRDGTYKTAIPSSNDDDINKMLIDINEISEKLQETIKSANDDRERLGYILNNVSDGIIVLDRSGIIGMINRNAGDIFRIDHAADREYTVLTGDSVFNQAVQKCLSDNSDSVFEYCDDRERTFLTSVRALERGYIIIVLSEITAVKNNEKNRSEFFADASHELKTPLTAIKGFNDMILLKAEDETIRNFSLKVDKEVIRIIGLINDMLDLSKLESPRELLPVHVDLREIAENVSVTLTPLASKKHVCVSVSGEGTVFAEAEHMTELVKNLVENGIRYNNPGGIVKVIISRVEDGIQLEVKDNGIGIEEKYQGRLFERFYRVNKSRSRETGGTGLGLAIVKHICELYGATLSLTSKLGIGTSVKILFHNRVSS